MPAKPKIEYYDPRPYSLEEVIAVLRRAGYPAGDKRDAIPAARIVENLIDLLKEKTTTKQHDTLLDAYDRLQDENKKLRQDLQAVFVDFDFSSSKVYLPVAKDLFEKVREQARQQGVSSETLVNLWLQERLSKSA